MTTLISRVARTLRMAGADRPAMRVAAAVSGGADSVALVWLLHRLAADERLTFAGIIHVNHQLRGAAADADEAFCRELADRVGVPFVSTRVDVSAIARDRRCSIETAARAARYEFFDRAAAELDAALVATGHTEDDQAETVLLRLLRGSGARGVSAIRLRRGRIVRPLLACRRAALRSYLASISETWREDSSNADEAIPRNRLRHSVMPTLEAFSPTGVAALARFARLASDDETLLRDLAIKSRAEIVLSSSDSPGAAISVAGLRALPGPIARRVIRETAAELVPAAALSARHLEAVCRLASTDKPTGHLDLPGLTAERVGPALELRIASAGSRQDRDGREGRQDWRPWPERELAVPGSVVLPEAGLVVGARPVTSLAEAVSNTPGAVAIRAATAALPLVVRNRRRGDRLQPLGAPGRRKLQDVLVDRKVPRIERDDVPIVTDASGQILWVAGVTVAETVPRHLARRRHVNLGATEA